MRVTRESLSDHRVLSLSSLERRVISYLWDAAHPRSRRKIGAMSPVATYSAHIPALAGNRSRRRRYRSRRAFAHAVSSCRLESCSFRSTADTCVSTVFVEM